MLIIHNNNRFRHGVFVRVFLSYIHPATVSCSPLAPFSFHFSPPSVTLSPSVPTPHPFPSSLSPSPLPSSLPSFPLFLSGLKTQCVSLGLLTGSWRRVIYKSMGSLLLATPSKKKPYTAVLCIGF